MTDSPHGANTSVDAPVPVVADPEQAWRALGMITDWIKHAETKSGATLTAAVAVATILYSLVKDQHHPGLGLSVAAVSCGSLVFAGAATAAWSLVPRLWRKDEATSNLYFDHIARKHSRHTGGTHYAGALRALAADNERMVTEIASQVWANAHVARQKYRWGSAGLVLVIMSLVPLAVVAGIIGFRST